MRIKSTIDSNSQKTEKKKRLCTKRFDSIFNFKQDIQNEIILHVINNITGKKGSEAVA